MLPVINNITTCDMLKRDDSEVYPNTSIYLGLQLDSWCCLGVRASLGLGELLGSWGRGAKREAPPVDRCAPIHPCALGPCLRFFCSTLLRLGKDYEYPVMEIIC